MKKTIILLCIFTLACTREEELSVTEFFIDTSKYPAEAIEIQDLIEDVYLIPLETTPECIIGSLSKLDQRQL